MALTCAPSISIAGLSRGFDRVTALSDVDLDVVPGELVAVVGASGSGKSTLLRLVGGLDEATSGSIDIGGRSPDELRQSKEIAWMAQRPALLPWRTVREQIVLVESINSQSRREPVDVDALLEMTDLSDFATAYPHTLSGGMAQRAALARSLAIGASVWLMDEPFAALDEITRSKMIDEMIRIRNEIDVTTIWVTHHISEAVRLADRVAVLTPRPGRIRAEVKVNLPRPRDETSAPFQDVIREIRGHLSAAQSEHAA